MISPLDILKANILVVDDRQANVELLEKILRGAGYLSVSSTRDPHEVCALHRKNGYSLILLDLEMPGLDGFQVMEGLKVIEIDCYLPVLVITARPDHKLRALKAGANDFVSKPFDLAEVLMRVHNLLEVRLLHLQAEMLKRAAEARSEQAIQASELNYRRLFEAAQDGILVLEVDTGRINDVNPFLTGLLGFTREEMIGKTVGELSPFKDIAANKLMLERLQRYLRVRYEDLPMQTKDGRQIAVEFVSNVYQAGDHKVIQCNVRDITERKHTEEQLKASSKEIGELKSVLDEQMASVRLAAIVESSDDAIMGQDLDGIVTSWNKGAEKILGYTAAEIIGTSITRLIPVNRQDEENHILGKIKRGEKVEHFETQHQTKDGRLIEVSVTSSAIKDASGKIVGVSKVARDITDRKAAEQIRLLNLDLEQRVVERTAQLESANRELQAFSYSVSHDLRAPLRHVLGFVELLHQDSGPSLSEKSLRHLTTISREAKRMGYLIDDLLAFSSIGQSEVRKTGVDLDELVRETLGDFQEETKGRDIAWKIHPLPCVQADRALLRMVLVNYISNSVKFTGARAKAQIEIGCAPGRGGETVIFCRDNGAGFNPKHTAKLFGVFQRLHSKTEFEGTGIGLANVQRIINRHGGRAWAEGVVDGGATFYFSIPKQNGGSNGH
jgi:PAS domain S-box-containing protein